MDYLHINRQLWNARAAWHATHYYYYYGRKSFEQERHPTLNEIELVPLGDLSGQSILHLQCHFGLDTLSLVRLGAQAVGVDFSEVAIAEARQLAVQHRLAAEFVCCNVYDVPQHIEQQFDVVFTSYGVIGWLPNLEAWVRVVAHSLKPGGRFIMAEFHPVVWMFDDNFTCLAYSYFKQDPIVKTLLGTYTDRQAPLKYESISWNHSLAEVIGALLHAGLHLAHLQEYDYSPYDCFAHSMEAAPGHYQIRGLEGRIPMVFSLLATKP